MYEKILIPLDGSRGGGAAIDHGVALAGKFGSELILLRVVSPSSAPVTAMPGPGSVPMQVMAVEAAEFENEAAEKRARNYLNSRRRQVEAMGVRARVHEEIGDPATVIKRVAEAEDVDLIVMSTRGRSGIVRAVLGSVADEIVRSDIAPVLLLHR